MKYSIPEMGRRDLDNWDGHHVKAEYWKTLIHASEDSQISSKFLAELASAHSQFIENLESDNNIDDSQRLKWLNLAIAELQSGKSSEIAACNACRSFPDIGPEDRIAMMLDLGHVLRREALETIFVMDGKSGSTANDVVLNVDAFLDSDLDWQRDCLTVRLSPYSQQSHARMFSFYDPDENTNPLESFAITAREVERRLGFASDDSVEAHNYVYWTHRLEQDDEPRVPTTFNAELSVYFRPTGQTWSPHIQNDSVPEVVHRPVHARNLRTAIRTVPEQ